MSFVAGLVEVFASYRNENGNAKKSDGEKLSLLAAATGSAQAIRCGVFCSMDRNDSQTIRWITTSR
jgi:hypothetical protein